MPLEDSARIGIHDKNRKLAGVEKDGVGSFRTNAMNGKDLFAKCGGRRLKHFGERAVILRSQKPYKLFQFPGFLPEVAGRTDQPSKLALRDAFHGVDGEELLFS